MANFAWLNFNALGSKAGIVEGETNEIRAKNQAAQGEG
jgi:hypothetical protein